MAGVGITLALACALITNVALLCKHRGAAAAPQVCFRRPLRSASSLFRSPWWALGFAIAAGAWALHVAALSLAPLSLVQGITCGGLVLLALPAKRWFGLELGRREWVGLGLAGAGLAVLVITLGHSTGAGTHFSVSAMVGFEAGALALAVALLVSGSAGRAARSAAMIALATGVLFGISDVALKSLADTVPADPETLLSPWTAVVVGCGVGAFLSLARGLQTGAAVAVITISSVAANVSAVLGGILVYGDPMGADAFQVVARSLALAAVVGAAAVFPAGPKPVAVPARSSIP